MKAGEHFEVREEIVLVADDDETIRLLAKQALNQSGFLVATATDGVEALSIFEQIHPDLVLLDVHMPRMDGFEICNRIRRQPSGFYTPILMVTGFDDVESIDRAYMMGATDFVTKPVNWTVLIHRVRYILRATKSIYRRIESEARNRALVEALPDMIFQIRRDGQILDFRPATTFEPHLPAHQFLESKIQDVLPTEVGQKCLESIERAFETNRIQQFEYSLSKGESEAQFEARIIAFGREKVLSIVRDVTEERRLLAELHQSQKMEALGLLAGGVAHDFNNALTVISFSAGILRKKLKDDEKLVKRVEAISESTQHAATLTSQLLAFSRKQDSRPQPTDLNSIVQQTQKMLRRLLGEDIRVSLKLEDELWNVLIDPTQVGQILMNFATNARDAMPEGGTFHMETQNCRSEEPDQFVRLVVSDTGSGMDGETLERVFEPFFTTKELGRGTGLGLSTVFGIVKQAGGEIRIESQLDEGTVFEIDFPRFFPEEKQLAVEEATRHWSAENCSETILVVEDEDQIRGVFCESLQAAGYEVLEAPNGTKALEVARDHSGEIDLLLTDVVMPEMSGAALAKELRALRPDLRVLYVTGYPDEVLRRQGVEPREVALIQKPFDNPVLGNRVRDVLDSRV